MRVVQGWANALQMAINESPDLILADVFMPGLNGYELCEAVRNNEALKDIPVLLLAGTFEPFDEAKSRAAGANDWIVKPFSSQGLIDKVEELLAHVPVAEQWQASPSQTPGDQDILQALEEVVASQVPTEPTPVEILSPGEAAPSFEPVAEVESPSTATEELAPFSFEIEEPVAEPAIEVETTSDRLVDPFAEANRAAPVEEIAAPAEDSFAVSQPDLAELPPLEDFSFTPQETPPSVVEEVAAPKESFSFDNTSFEQPSVAESTAVELSVAEPVGAAIPIADFQVAAQPEVAAVSQDGIIELKESDIAEEGAYGATPERVEKRVAFLSDEQLTEIVERVAGAVIERLAAPMLEQVVWEVVPDLAESMVREEMAKIKPDA
ncbi:MAG: hypothetical protein B6I37_05070 [Desulfobacteraceae bacterium 4572_35.2]|nr:MAG: hypothetical protein B6I37_05070 [Desulfobacteraceae bacterium 4572_35.2]